MNSGRKFLLIRWCAGLCALMLLAASVGVAMADSTEQTSAFSAKGSVGSPTSFTVLAPMGGQVRDFAWKPGDSVTAEAKAIQLTSTQVYATCDGLVRGIHATQGSQASQIIAQYGSLCSLERDDIRYVQAPMSSAYDKVENRDIRLGETLRVRQGIGDSEETGTGTVIQVEKGNYLVEMAKGEFDLEENVTLYRGTGDTYADKDKVGKGKVVRPPLLPLMGDGVIAEVLVTEGQKVTRGQPLLTLDAASAHHDQPPLAEVTFGKQGVIQEVLVRPGQFVVQGQALMTVASTEGLEAVLDVDELDIAKVSVGQKVRVAVDSYAGAERSGTVREILPQGITVLDTTKFHVKVVLDDASGLLIGMHATGYWN